MYDSSTLNKPLLSIIIPTYHRSNELNRLLSRYANLLDKISNIEIIVSSNCPEDPGTESVLEKVRAQYSDRITAITQHVSLGPIIHIAYLYSLAKGRYTWMHSDDDSVSDVDLKVIIERVSSGDSDCYFIPYSYPGEVGTKRNGIVNSDRAIDIYIDNFPWPTLLTSVIIRTDAIQSELTKLRSFTLYFPFSLYTRAMLTLSGSSVLNANIVAGREFTFKSKKDQTDIFIRCLLREVVDNAFLSNRQKAKCIDLFFSSRCKSVVTLAIKWPSLFIACTWLSPQSFFLYPIRVFKRLFCGRVAL